MPEFLRDWVDSPVLYLGLAGLGLVLLTFGWWRFGRGPRRQRGFKRVQRLLREGAWQPALELVRELSSGGRVSSSWQGRLRQAEADCLNAAAAAALKDKQFEQSLDFQLQAAELVARDEAEARALAVEALLREVRRQFAATSGADTDRIHQLLGRVQQLRPLSLEAFFWTGLCHVREGNNQQAVTALDKARGGEAASSAFVDPALYLGGLFLRLGQAKDALRYLTEANRIDANCPIVKWQLASAILAAAGDATLAVRALQQVVSPRSLPMWLKNPARLWVEAFPENRSYVRKLASEHPYTCPLWGDDLPAILRQCNLALAQGLYRVSKFQEAAELFQRLLQESAPSLAILRGLGLSLARLERFDEAFKHLRTAHELENPKDRLTAGYLALCGALGKPSRPEDKTRNVAWAVRLVCGFTAPGDREWVHLVSAIFAEARSLSVPLDVDDQLYLCEHLVSIAAADAAAAAAYLQLAVQHPQALRPEYAWLYCRAALQHGLDDRPGLELFAHTFAHADQAQAYFAAQNWDFAEIEFAYLNRAAKHQPGRFPPVLGADYAARGEALLIERSQREEAANRLDAAVTWAEVLQRLSPHNPRALDRLAELHYRRGNLDAARQLLESWRALDAADTRPLVRLAVIHQQLGAVRECLDMARLALERRQGNERTAIALLGARLALRFAFATQEANGQTVVGEGVDSVAAAAEFLHACLQVDPAHAEALWLLAAIRSLKGDRVALTEQAPMMQRPDVADARFHYLAALCRLAADNCAQALEACGRAAQDPALAIESSYVLGWTHLHRRDPQAAAEALQVVAKTATSPSAGHARALLGGIRFHQENHDEAIRCWHALEAQKRADWRLTEALQQTVFLSALEALHAGRHEQAAERIREAGKLGLRDRRLGALLNVALVKAGQDLLYNKS